MRSAEQSLGGRRCRGNLRRDLGELCKRRFRGNAFARACGLFGAPTQRAQPWAGGEASKRCALDSGPWNLGARFVSPLWAALASRGSLRLRSAGRPASASAQDGVRFWGLPYNTALQATPVAASAAFGRLRAVTGAPERNRCAPGMLSLTFRTEWSL